MDDLFTLKGRTALVTGGSRGIGRMIAAGLLAAGAKVYITARKAAACDEAAEQLSAAGGTCISLPIDISTLEGVERLANEVGRREATLDILVNNAGANWQETFETFPEKGWDKVMDLNVKSPFFLCQALLGLLKAASSKDQPAKVINIVSIDGISLNSLEIYSYTAAKAGLIHLTKRMAMKLIEDNIVVSAIAPGAFQSSMNIEARDDEEGVAHRIPAKRVGRASDMAGAAVYLASRAGDYVVGSTLIVDGGVTYAR